MKNVKKRKATLFVVLLSIVAILITACGGTKSEKNVSSTTNVVVEKNTEPKETPEPTIKPEIKEELIVEDKEETIEEDPYAGIDMESTLPGLEWMATFDNVVDEPLVIVYNDETNKKVIVNEGDEVEFSKSSDILALYTPNNETMPALTLTGEFKEIWAGGNELSDALTSKRKILCKKNVSSSDDTQKCTADVMIDGEIIQYDFVLKFVE